MKRVSMMRTRCDVLHVETPLGIVNIHVGLTDQHGRRVESVEVIPNNYTGEPHVELDGYANTRLIEHPSVIEEKP